MDDNSLASGASVCEDAMLGRRSGRARPGGSGPPQSSCLANASAESIGPVIDTHPFRSTSWRASPRTHPRRPRRTMVDAPTPGPRQSLRCIGRRKPARRACPATSAEVCRGEGACEGGESMGPESCRKPESPSQQAMAQQVQMTVHAQALRASFGASPRTTLAGASAALMHTHPGCGVWGAVVLPPSPHLRKGRTSARRLAGGRGSRDLRRAILSGTSARHAYWRQFLVAASPSALFASTYATGVLRFVVFRSLTCCAGRLCSCRCRRCHEVDHHVGQRGHMCGWIFPSCL